MFQSPVSPENYLTLALFSRSVVDELRDLFSSGRRTKHLRKILPEAIGSLQAATDGQQAHLTGYGLKMVQNYDQVQMINQVFPKKKDRDNMIKTLRLLQAGQRPITRQKTAAMEAIKFFDAIESRALRNYRDSSQGE